MNTKTFFGYILDIEDDRVEVHTLIAHELGVKSPTQRRWFPLEVLEGAVDLAINNVIEITVETGIGYQSFRYKNAKVPDAERTHQIFHEMREETAKMFAKLGDTAFLRD